MLIVLDLWSVQDVQLISHCFHLGVSVSDFGMYLTSCSCPHWLPAGYHRSAHSSARISSLVE